MRKNRDTKPETVRRPLSIQARDQAIGACLRIVAGGIKRALLLLADGPGAWVCDRCGPLPAGVSPLHGIEEQLYCPNSECEDGKVRADLPAEPLKKPGTPWRSAPAVGPAGEA